MEQQRFVRKNTVMFDAQRRNDKKRTRRTVFYVFLFVFVTLVFLAVTVAVFLNVKSITVSGNQKYTYEQIIELVSIKEGDNIYSFDSDEIEENIKQALPYIGSVEVKRDLPTTVEINIVEETPYFAADLAGDTYILSTNLKVLERFSDTSPESAGLAILTLNNVRQCIVGQPIEFVNQRTLDAVTDLYQSFDANYIEDKIKGVDVRSRFDIYIDYDNRFEVYIGDTENIDIKIRFLVSILGELEPDATGVIDVSDPHEASVALS